MFHKIMTSWMTSQSTHKFILIPLLFVVQIGILRIASVVVDLRAPHFDR
jgi:hypothetical protein